MSKHRGRWAAAAVSILLQLPVLGGSPTPSLRNIPTREIELQDIQSSVVINVDGSEPVTVEDYHALEKNIFALENWENEILGTERQPGEEPQSIAHGLPIRPVSEGDGGSLHKERKFMEALQSAAALSIIRRTSALQELHEGNVAKAKKHLDDAIRYQKQLHSFKSQHPSIMTTLYHTKLCRDRHAGWTEVKKNYKGLPTEAELSLELENLAIERHQLEAVKLGSTLKSILNPLSSNKNRPPGQPGENQYTAVDFAIRALKNEISADASLRNANLFAALQSLRSAQKAQAQTKKARDAWVAETGEHFSLMEYPHYESVKKRYQRPSMFSKVKSWLGTTSGSVGDHQ